MGVPLFHIGCAGFGQGRRRQIAQGAKIRVALIGCGHRMGEIIQLVLAEKVVAMVDPDPACIAKLREKIAKIPGGSEAVAGSVNFSDYREMFDKMGDSVDAVFICTPNHHHALAAVWAMKRGIHVYVEKPMALNVAEAKYMQQLAKETGVTTQVGNFGHSTRAMALCVKALKEKVIGDIEDVWCYDDRVNALDHRPPASKPPEGMNWDAWVGPAPWVDYYGPEGKRKFGLHPHDFHCWQGGCAVLRAQSRCNAADLRHRPCGGLRLRGLLVVPDAPRMEVPRAGRPWSNQPPLVRRAARGA